VFGKPAGRRKTLKITPNEVGGGIDKFFKKVLFAGDFTPIFTLNVCDLNDFLKRFGASAVY